MSRTVDPVTPESDRPNDSSALKSSPKREPLQSLVTDMQLSDRNELDLIAAKRKGRRAWMVYCVGVCTVILAISAYLFATRGEETSDDAQVEADVVQLSAKVGGEVVNCGYRVTNAQLRAGTATITDLLDAQSALTQAHLNLVRAGYARATANVLLAHAIGA